jgi:fluoride exporter
LNPLSHVVPIGTLTANLLGGFTTFSAFSNEVVSLLAEGRPGWASVTATAHVAGSLALTVLGILTVRTMT